MGGVSKSVFKGFIEKQSLKKTYVNMFERIEIYETIYEVILQLHK